MFPFPFFLIASWIFVGNCGVALTSETYVKVPPKTETEVFRLNLLYGEAHSLYGANLGLMNLVNRLIGVQIGIVNVAENSSGVQVGLINNSRPMYAALKIGLFNFNFFLDRGMSGQPPYEGYKEKNEDQTGKGGASIGILNFFSGKFNVGFFNVGEGFNLGLVNWTARDTLNVGIVNIHADKILINPKYDALTVSFGIFNSGKYTKELQIGIVNYCPNNTIPVMIIANY
ncbi:LA_2272/LA_2273 family lipoprotein [Leptospira santarosai]|uniref:LA_2272/LA_2273 family lipoprotein n=1 Tax=Leptospira santarosai TaxID=28183 RepID=UPI0038B3F430